MAAVSYEYGKKHFDLTEKLLEIEKRIPSLEKIILVDFLGKGYEISKFTKGIDYKTIVQEHQTNDQIEFTKVPFAHPVYIMYSSGTTGKPKCIVHSQGGTLLQLIKEHGLHCDLKQHKSTFFFTTCGWMMWNWLVAGLYFGSTVVLYEGSPAEPSPEYFFNMIEREGIHIFGTSPKFLAPWKIQGRDLQSIQRWKQSFQLGHLFCRSNLTSFITILKKMFYLAVFQVEQISFLALCSLVQSCQSTREKFNVEVWDLMCKL